MEHVANSYARSIQQMRSKFTNIERMLFVCPRYLLLTYYYLLAETSYSLDKYFKTKGFCLDNSLDIKTLRHAWTLRKLLNSLNVKVTIM